MRRRSAGALRVVVAAVVIAASGPNAASPAALQAQLVTIREGTNVAAALSPDGETLAVDLLGSIWLVPLAGGAAERLTDALGDARQPAWSPDGQRIAFQSYRDGNWHIWSVRANGLDLTQHTDGPFDDREPTFSADGTRMAFSSDRGGNYDIWVLELESGATRQITQHPEADFGPAFLPGDSGIVYSAVRTDEHHLIARRPDGGERIVATVAGRLAGVSPDPTGVRVAFNEIGDGVSRLAVADLDDGSPRTVSAAGEDVFPFRAAWISDAELAYTADGLIKRLLLPAGDRAETADPRVVEIAADVTLYRTPYERRRRDFDGTGSRRVRGIVSPVVSPAGDAVAFAALGDLWSAPLGGDDPAPVRLTADPFVELDPAFSPDGSLLAFASNRGGSFDIWLRRIDDGSERQLTELPGRELMPAFSPDGERIAFIDQDGRVMAVEVASGEVATLHAPLRMPGRPAWTGDGRNVVVAALSPYSDRFREGRNEFLLISLEGDADRRVTPMPHRSLGTRGYDGPVPSPDGGQLAFTAGGVLWVVDVGPGGEPTSEPRRLTGEIADSPSWTGDGAHVVYLSSGRLRRVAVADGTVEELPVELTWQPSMPQGRRLVHAGAVFDGRNDGLRRNVDILIDGHRIAAVEDHSATRHEELAAADDGAVVDASTLTVMPGLIEMHTHQSPDIHRTWLAYGITTVREPATNAYQALEMREAIAAGVRPGPREFFSGETFDGSRIYYSGSMAMDGAAAVALQMERAAALEHDLIKTYVRLTDTLQLAVVARAHALGMPVSSHELYPAVAFGVDGVEHIRGTSRRGYSPKVSELNRSYQDVIELLTASRMTLTPTVGIMGGFWLAAARDPALLDDPRFAALFPAEQVESARQRAADLRVDPARQQAIAEQLIGPYGNTLRRIIDGGGRIIAGTDSPIIPAGVSLHAELENFVDGGLTPFEALRTATLWAAEALGAETDLGTIERGKLADLAVVEGDPLADIRATRNLRFVVKNGEIYPLAELLR